MNGLFVTGTDTGVGKTLLAAGLALWLRQNGVRVAVLKPFLTGTPPEDPNSDASILRLAAGAPESPSEISPVFFPEPAAPYTALRKSGGRLDRRRVLEPVERAKASGRFLLIEGIGGVCVPLDEGYLVKDFMREAGLPALIVGRNRLGGINHMLLSSEALKAAGVEIAGFVLNEGPEPPAAGDETMATNAGDIERLSGARFLGTAPYIESSAPPAEKAEKICGWIERQGRFKSLMS